MYSFDALASSAVGYRPRRWSWKYSFDAQRANTTAGGGGVAVETSMRSAAHRRSATSRGDTQSRGLMLPSKAAAVLRRARVSPSSVLHAGAQISVTGVTGEPDTRAGRALQPGGNALTALRTLRAVHPDRLRVEADCLHRRRILDDVQASGAALIRGAAHCWTSLKAAPFQRQCLRVGNRVTTYSSGRTAVKVANTLWM